MINSNNLLSKSTFGVIRVANIKQFEEAEGKLKLQIYAKKIPLKLAGF